MENGGSVGEGGQRAGRGVSSSGRWDRWLRTAAIAVASIGLGYLFFTQLWWKLPPEFACSEDFQFEGENASGLCFWIGTQEYYSEEPRVLLQSDITSGSGPEVGVSIGLVQRLNGAFIDSVIQPNIRWFGWVFWGMEAFIFLSLVLGFLSRLGALVAIAVSAQLMVGLAGIPSPVEWEWSYNLMVLLSVLLFGIAPGRYFGLDRLLRPRLMVLRERGSRLGTLLLACT